MPTLDDPRHEKFAQELARGASNADAYMAAGYNTKSVAAASANANRLLKNAAVRARVEELQGKAAEIAVLDRAWVLDRLMRNARICMGEETVKVKRAKRGTTDVQEIEVHARDPREANKALELLGKTPELALFIDRVEQGRPGEFAQMTDEELERFIAEKAPNGHAH